ncbi:MAG: ATP-binding protein [Oscillospiraceae bacterium]|nr:ATP-binding protein [Oscillospiraceae bacterium]
MSFISELASGPRKIAVTGPFGCGKSEFSVSLACALAGIGDMKTALCDLDIENPYFRSREMKAALEERGIEVFSDPFDGKNGSELQTISPKVKAPLENPMYRTVLDTGGDYTGAMVLNQFSRQLSDAVSILFVINKYRFGSDTVEKVKNQISSIESVTGLSVTGLVSNTHLIKETTLEDLLEGYEFALEAEKEPGIPLLCTLCPPFLAHEAEGKIPDLFPIGMYLRASYLDKRI